MLSFEINYDYNNHFTSNIEDNMALLRCEMHKKICRYISHNSYTITLNYILQT